MCIEGSSINYKLLNKNIINPNKCYWYLVMFSSSNSNMIEQNHWNILCHESEKLVYKLVSIRHPAEQHLYMIIVISY
jgi:hypothetical protein